MRGEVAVALAEGPQPLDLDALRRRSAPTRSRCPGRRPAARRRAAVRSSTTGGCVQRQERDRQPRGDQLPRGGQRLGVGQHRFQFAAAGPGQVGDRVFGGHVGGEVLAVGGPFDGPLRQQRRQGRADRRAAGGGGAARVARTGGSSRVWRPRRRRGGESRASRRRRAAPRAAGRRSAWRARAPWYARPPVPAPAGAPAAGSSGESMTTGNRPIRASCALAALIFAALAVAGCGGGGSHHSDGGAREPASRLVSRALGGGAASAAARSGCRCRCLPRVPGRPSRCARRPASASPRRAPRRASR